MKKLMQNSRSVVMSSGTKRPIRNMAINQNLPRLPVPKLSETIDKYLRSVEPHLTAAELENTRNVSKTFMNGIGDKLQNMLLKRYETEENWLSDWWLENAYLKYRDPVVVWSSPGLVFPERKFSSDNERAKFAAQVISATLNYKTIIDSGKMPTEMMGKSELDMQQYSKIFGTCRIPKPTTDGLVYNPKSQHIVLMIDNRFYKVPVYDSKGNPLCDTIIVEQIEECVKLSKENRTKAPRIGILTSDNRDNWAIAYDKLEQISQNRKCLDEIESSLFILSLDREISSNADSIITACHQLIHGGGSQFNGSNRWFDKTIQFVVGSPTVNGLTYEHSPAEGQPIAMLTDYIIKFISECDKNPEKLQSNQMCTRAVPLEFVSTPEIDGLINIAAKNLDKLANNLDMNYLHFTDYGKDFIKSQRVSPDSYIQMAIQYAFYRIHKTPGAHYESAQTRKFIHGRTECIRSCSNESVAFARAMCEGHDDNERLLTLRRAIDSHKKYANDAVNGLGVDRHLLGLKLIARENGIPIPSFYEDKGYVKSSTMRLSTSQVASVHNAFMCYGPLTEDGYGCCYNPRKNDMWFGLSSLKSCSNTCTETFKKSLEESLRQMRDVLIRTSTESTIKSKL